MGRIPVWIALFFLAFDPGLAPRLVARGKPAVWLEVRSPDFTVITDAGEGQGRTVVGRFEQIRAVFRMTFPTLQVDPAVPIVAIAVKNQSDFRALSPAEWLGKNEMTRSGYFHKSSDINYVVLCLSGEGDNPYHILFHEYTHLLLHQGAPTIPLWLDEGLAEFYGNSEIHSKEVWLGEPSADDVEMLRSRRLLPLATLFAVDSNSPYYHEENKGSVFYGESWALTHYLMATGARERKNLLGEYMTAVAHGVDPVAAAAHSFGDLGALEKNLESYLQQANFAFLKVPGTAAANPKSFMVRELSTSEADAVRGDLLARNGRYADAKALLQEALQENPQNAAAAFSMGFLEFQQDHEAEAQKWFTQAVTLNAKSYLAHYYFAALAMKSGHVDPSAAAQVEKSLHTAIQINPHFAPAYDALARFYAIQGTNLDQAHMLTLEAVELDPANVYYYLDSASILLRMNRVEDAITVGQNAEKIAKLPAELAAAQSFLTNALKYQAYVAEREKYQEELQQAATTQRTTSAPTSFPAQENTSGTPPATEPLPTPPVLRHANATRGARDMSNGTIQNVRCNGSSLDLDFQTSHETLHLYTDDYFNVQFRAANYKPTGQLYPCQQIQGRKAQITFYDIKGSTDQGEIISVALMK